MAKLLFNFLFLLCFLTQVSTTFAQNNEPNIVLSLEQYLQQVQSKNLNIIAYNQQQISNEKLAKKSQLITAIKFYSFSERSFAEQNQALQLFRYSKLYNQNNQVGLNYQSSYGFETNLAYSLNKTNYKNLILNNNNNNPLFRSNSQATSSIELNFALWQNFLGNKTKANISSIYNQHQFIKLNSLGLSMQEKIEAEIAYWHLFYCQKNVIIQQQALTSANKIFDYLYKKSQMNLAETNDVLQAKAMVQTKKLNLSQAKNQLNQAKIIFNQKRNINNQEVSENISEPNIASLQSYLFESDLQKQSPQNPFLLAQKNKMQANIALAEIEKENQKPMLNLYGSYARNVAEANTKLAFNNSFDSNNRANSGNIGIQFSMPINFALTNQIIEGAEQQILAEKNQYQQQQLQYQNTWQNLNINGIALQENLKLALDILQIQKNKLNQERLLLKKGRTSTYQILMFEQDFSLAEANLWQIIYQLQQTIASRQIYNL
jgi:outer membrane protein TolC